MIDPVSSMMNLVMAREAAAMSLAKSRMEAEAAVVQIIMEAAKNIERITKASSSSHIGTNIDIYV